MSTRPSLVNMPTTAPFTPSLLKAAISSSMTFISASLKRKSPVRGLIMTYVLRILLLGIRSTIALTIVFVSGRLFLMDLTKPIEGVVPPPSPRFEHISRRSAPPATALELKLNLRFSKPKSLAYLRAASSESTHTSIVIVVGIFVNMIQLAKGKHPQRM